jgi:hypothetical protein
MREQQQTKKNIVPSKAGLTHETRDLDIRYVHITCLLCILDHEVKIFQ